MKNGINQGEGGNLSRAPFRQRFRVDVDLESTKQAFVNRIQNRIEKDFFWLENYETSEPEGYRGILDGDILQYVANKLGCRYYFKDNFSDYHRGAQDFDLLLRSLEALHEAINIYTPNRQTILEDIINSTILESEADLGVQWRDGAFWPSGVKLLDTALVNDNLDWLSGPQFKNILLPFQKGLKEYLEAPKNPDKLADTVTDMYEALEAMAKLVTGKEKRDLSGNREMFVNRLKLSNYYKKMLQDYITYANDYRHGVEASRERALPVPNEVEAFIYMTGLFIRLAIRQLGTTR